MANILRLFIVVVIFILGVIIGNVYLPQKNFDQKNIIAPQRPKTSFDVDNVPPIDTVLKEAENYKNFLIESGQDQEEIISFENNFKRTISQLYYKEAAATYALELLRIQLQPDHTTPYIKARDEYKKLIELMETLYPIETPKEVIVIKEENPELPALPPVQNNNVTTSTETIKSTQTVASAEIVPSTQTAETKQTTAEAKTE